MNIQGAVVLALPIEETRSQILALKSEGMEGTMDISEIIKHVFNEFIGLCAVTKRKLDFA